MLFVVVGRCLLFVVRPSLFVVCLFRCVLVMYVRCCLSLFVVVRCVCWDCGCLLVVRCSLVVVACLF